MAEVVFEPAPRFVVELGEEVETFAPVEVPMVAWSFFRRFSSLADAQACAVREAETEAHVRVVDTGRDGPEIGLRDQQLRALFDGGA